MASMRRTMARAMRWAAVNEGRKTHRRAERNRWRESVAEAQGVEPGDRAAVEAAQEVEPLAKLLPPEIRREKGWRQDRSIRAFLAALSGRRGR